MVETSQKSKESIADFAKKIKTKPDVLLKQLKSAGIVSDGAKEQDPISKPEKESLLNYLRKDHGKNTKSATEIVLKRAKVIGKGKVQVKVLSKRKYKRKVTPEPPKVETAVAAEQIETAADSSLTEQSGTKKINTTEQTNQAQSDLSTASDSQQAEKTSEATTVTEAVEQAEPTKENSKESVDKTAKTSAQLAPAPEENKGKKRTAKKTDKRKKSFADEGKDKAKGLKQSKKRSKIFDDSRVGRSRKRDNKKHKAAVETIMQKHAFELPTEPKIKEIVIPTTVTVAELAKRMSVKAAEVIKQLMQLGMMATINQPLDQDTAQLVVEEMGHKVILKRNDEIELEIDVEYKTEAVVRPPVVTIMGHVDHGKTSLLDFIRSTQVTEKEAGGITQHIGAYQVQKDRGKITFLDTPGHAAFSNMRARGAKVTDIVILVVAADDGVMPQTIEAIKHAKAAEVPIIVAVNKIDKPESDSERIRTELSQHEVISEQWGGDTQFVNVSAKTGEGVETLLEAILLQSEVLELKAADIGPAKGVVIESRKDKGRGVVATMLVQQGCLNTGDIVVAGIEFGRVRAMLDEMAKNVDKAIPAMPIEILGLTGTPNAGDAFIVVQDERKAREVVEHRRIRAREQKLARQQSGKLEGFFEKIKEGDVSHLNIVLKADVHGSAEALTDALQKLSTDEVKVNIVSASVGAISESDVNLAFASKAIILGFNVRADATARQIIERESIGLHYFSVIYDVIDRIKGLMKGLLAPMFEDKILGVATVRNVFRSSKMGAIAGCMVQEGVVKRNKPIRVLRDNVVIFEGELESLRRFKEEANEVKSGLECGIGVKNYNDVVAGDSIEVFDRVQVERTL